MDRLSRAEAEAVFRRAAELERSADGPAEDGLTRDEVVRVGLEAGLSDLALTAALAELDHAPARVVSDEGATAVARKVGAPAHVAHTWASHYLGNVGMRPITTSGEPGWVPVVDSIGTKLEHRVSTRPLGSDLSELRIDVDAGRAHRQIAIALGLPYAVPFTLFIPVMTSAGSGETLYSVTMVALLIGTIVNVVAAPVLFLRAKGARRRALDAHRAFLNSLPGPEAKTAPAQQPSD